MLFYAKKGLIGNYIGTFMELNMELNFLSTKSFEETKQLTQRKLAGLYKTSSGFWLINWPLTQCNKTQKINQFILIIAFQVVLPWLAPSPPNKNVQGSNLNSGFFLQNLHLLPVQTGGILVDKPGINEYD